MTGCYIIFYVDEDSNLPVEKQKVNFNDDVMRFSINSRRYLGNKFKLNDFIRRNIEHECGYFETFADLFAGTGAVATVFCDKKLIVNDILYSNYVCHQTWFGTENYSPDKIVDYIRKYNEINVTEDNYWSKNYADTYFSLRNCRKAGFIRGDIEEKYSNGDINHRERCILITSLIYALDKIANTCGHYDAYRKNGNLEKTLLLKIPVIRETNRANKIYNEDASGLAPVINADVVYLDPPYNSRQYCDAYHLLENIAQWQKPQVYGVAGKMDRTGLKSEFCTANAVYAFEYLIKSLNTKYIVLSYNNMAQKGVRRSNAKISDSDIIRILHTKGTVKMFKQDYKTFSTGKSEVAANEERLFICKCF